MRKLLFNAVFHDLSDLDGAITAILVDGDRIADTFDNVPSIPDAEPLDLRGAHVFPGLVDSHTHAFEGGLYSLGVDLTGCRKLEEVFARLSEAKPIGGFVFSYRLDETQLVENRFPTPAELDRVIPGLPLLLRRIDGHSCVVNSIAAGRILANTGVFSDGVRRGRENDATAHWFHRRLDPDGILAAYHRAAEIALEYGLVGVHAMIGDAANDPLHFELIRNHLRELPIQYTLYPQILDINRAIALNSPRIGGCILVDGAIGSHTAAVKSPYADDAAQRGTLYRTDDEWLDLYSRADAAGIQVAVHAIGDAAVEQIVRICEKLPRPSRNRHMLIHCEIADDALLDRIANLGMVAAMQPLFDALWGGSGGLYEQRLGSERVLRMNRLRSMTERGIILGGSSDWYIVDLDPMAGYRAAIRHHNPDERLTPIQAMRMYARNHAFLNFTEHENGLIEKGYYADLTLFSGDPLKDPDQARVSGVIRRGNIL
jgi:predicted amidohydrolase YtcJ